MDNVLKVYEKYLSTVDYSEPEDDSDIDLSFGEDALKNLGQSPLSKSRRKSAPRASIPNDLISSIEQVTENFICNLQQPTTTNLEIPADILTALNQMGDENVMNLMKKLDTETIEKKEEVSALIRTKFDQQLKTMQQIIDSAEETFQRRLKLIEATDFKDKFDIDTDVFLELNDKLKEMERNILEYEGEKLQSKLRKQLGLEK